MLGGGGARGEGMRGLLSSKTLKLRGFLGGLEGFKMVQGGKGTRGWGGVGGSENLSADGIFAP